MKSFFKTIFEINCHSMTQYVILVLHKFHEVKLDAVVGSVAVKNCHKN